MPYAIASPAMRIHYETHGTEGPWVVLLMGLGASSRMWLDVPERLVRHATPYRVMTIDLPGTGGSDRLRRPCSLRTMATHVTRAMDAADVDRAYLVGMSMGGMVAQHVALTEAHRLLGLVLMATTPGLLHGSWPTPRALRSLFRASMGTHDHTLIADLILAPSQRHQAEALSERLSEAFRAAPTRTEAFLWQLVASALHSTGRDLRRIETPTVVVTGDDDIVMGRKSSRVLAARIPNAVLEVVASCGQGISFTHPDVVAHAIGRLRGGSQPTS
jgi:pimeloyl-ACP methyl ester carboxylesterase